MKFSHIFVGAGSVLSPAAGSSALSGNTVPTDFVTDGPSDIFDFQQDVSLCGSPSQSFSFVAAPQAVMIPLLAFEADRSAITRVRSVVKHTTDSSSE